jgi:hypothetical protein
VKLDMAQREHSRLGHREKWLGVDENLMELRDRIPSGVAKADMNYMRHLRMDATRHEQEHETIFDFAKSESPAGRTQYFFYKNYFKQVVDYVEPRIAQEFNLFTGHAYHHRQLIDRCFYSNNVEEIMENLRKENHPFARECLDAMSRNSIQSMQLALAMLRKANNLDYKGCL